MKNSSHVDLDSKIHWLVGLLCFQKKAVNSVKRNKYLEKKWQGIQISETKLDPNRILMPLGRQQG